MRPPPPRIPTGVFVHAVSASRAQAGRVPEPMIGRLASPSRSITGRLSAVILILCLAFVATNIQTMLYLTKVTAALGAVAHRTLDGTRDADAFDELLDQHRRLVVADAKSGAAGRPQSMTDLRATEQNLS